MDEIFSAIVRLTGRLIGRNIDYSFDCDISELGWAEYSFLVVIFIVFFVATRKAITSIKKRNVKKHT